MEKPSQCKGCYSTRDGLASREWEFCADQRGPLAAEQSLLLCYFSFAEVEDDTQVSFLIDQDRFVWNELAVKELFLPHEANIILSIPLSFRRPPDRIAWSLTPSGLFSTSSAYKLIVSGASTSMAGSSTVDDQRQFWKGLW